MITNFTIRAGGLDWGTVRYAQRLLEHPKQPTIESM